MMSFLQQRPWLPLSGALLAVVAVWWTGLQYPILSDTARYAVLGEQVWSGNGYTLFGEPYAKHLPLHAVVSYPLVWLLGYNIGIKTASLLAGLATVLLTYAIGRRQFGVWIGVGAAWAVALHHAFGWMTIVGSADLLFTAVFLGGVYAFLRAEDDDRWYVLAGACWGLACVTRYNGVPLLALYLLYGWWARPYHRQSMSYWCGLLLGGGVFGLWLLRNWRLFGNPLFTEYTGELGKETLGPLAQLVSNALYYVNPLQNILPVLLLFALYGLWKQGRSQVFLVWAMVAVWLITAVWWVQATRFAFPGYPILLLFAVYGIARYLSRVTRWRWGIIGLLGAALLVTHAGALCLYTFGQCNARFDAIIGGIPPNLGLSSEGYYASAQARDYINRTAEPNATVVLNGTLKPVVWSRGVFRDDLRLTTDRSTCPYYRLTREPLAEEEVVYTTTVHPQASVVLHRCQ